MGAQRKSLSHGILFSRCRRVNAECSQFRPGEPWGHVFGVADEFEARGNYCRYGYRFVGAQATKTMQLVPGATQNTFEAVVEFLYDMLEGIVGKHMVGRVFSLLATLFIFILVANWFGLLPGVGSIGWGHDVPGYGFEVVVPLVAAHNR